MAEQTFPTTGFSSLVSNMSLTAVVTEDYSTSLKSSLIVIYVITFLGGIAGIIIMSNRLKNQRNNLSITTTSIMNLIVAHSLFLLTVPFRIHYYATSKWVYSFPFCKLVSIALHVHIYLCFFFYIAIQTVRLLPVFGCKPQDSYRPLVTSIASVSAWFIFFVSIFPFLWTEYGKKMLHEENTCFQFHSEIKDNTSIVVFNIMIAGTVVLACFIVLALQLFVLYKEIKSNLGNLFSQQEFRAHLKNLTFIAIMFICFLPYHIFRIHYVQNIGESKYLIKDNEIYLSITSLCCLDLLTFLSLQK